MLSYTALLTYGMDLTLTNCYGMESTVLAVMCGKVAPPAMAQHVLKAWQPGSLAAVQEQQQATFCI
jgi:hypothetical protein